jgi:hypothetical protein
MIKVLNLLYCAYVGCFEGRTIIKLINPLLFAWGEKSVIEVPAEFECDQESVPRLPIIFLMWGDRAHRPAVLHDFLYRSDSKPLVSRSTADQFFYEAILSTGESGFIARSMWLGVRVGGYFSYHKYVVKRKYPDACYAPGFGD